MQHTTRLRTGLACLLAAATFFSVSPAQAEVNAWPSLSADSATLLQPDLTRKEGKVEALWSLDYGRTLLNDAAYVFGAPARWNSGDWQTFSLRAVTLLGTSTLLDQSIRDFAQTNRNATTNSIADRFDKFGMDYPSWVMGGFFLSGLLFNNNTAKMVALDGIAANLIACEVITPFLKSSIGRYRPYRDQGPHNFASNSGHDSFPSGHATRAFVNAAVIAAHYDEWWIKAIAYGVATLVSFARINYDMHYASDVLAGAFIGIAVGEGIVKLNKEARGFIK